MRSAASRCDRCRECYSLLPRDISSSRCCCCCYYYQVFFRTRHSRRPLVWSRTFAIGPTTRAFERTRRRHSEFPKRSPRISSLEKEVSTSPSFRRTRRTSVRLFLVVVLVVPSRSSQYNNARPKMKDFERFWEKRERFLVEFVKTSALTRLFLLLFLAAAKHTSLSLRRER